MSSLLLDCCNQPMVPCCQTPSGTAPFASRRTAPTLASWSRLKVSCAGGGTEGGGADRRAVSGGRLDEAALSLGAEPVAVAADRQHVAVVQEPVEDRGGDHRITEHCRAPQSSIGWSPRSRLRTRDIPYSVASLRRCRSARHEVPATSLCSFPTGGDARSECRRLILTSHPSHRTQGALRCLGSACVPLSH